MPDVRIVNETPHILNIALSQICPLHFTNAVEPSKAFKAHTGSVFFTVEWRIDAESVAQTRKSSPKKEKGKVHSNRYSAAKSARTIAIVTAAGLSTVALAGPLALSAAAAAGSATAASLLASSAVLTAASTAEALAFSTYAASTLTASAVQAVCEDTGVSPERSAQLQKQIDVVSSVVTASGIARGAATATANGARKAIFSAGSAILTRVAKSKEKDKEKRAMEEELLDSRVKKTERVYGIYIGFKPRNLAIREIEGVDGEKVMQLWDTDRDQRLT